MAQNLAVTGGAHLACASMCAGAILDSDTSASTAISKQDEQSNGSKTSGSEEQGTKTSERKTVLIRERVVQASGI